MRYLLTALFAVILLQTLSCAPVHVHDAGLFGNPVEILDRSPRIYHIGFREFADSIQTVRASAYLAGGIVGDFIPEPLRVSSLEDSSGKALAHLEYSKALKRLSAGAPGAAMKHIQQALEADPTLRAPYILLGNLLLSQHRVEEALPLFRMAVSLDSTDSQALVGLGRCRMWLGELEKAEGALVDAVIFDRVNLLAWQILDRLGLIRSFEVVNRDAPECALVSHTHGRHHEIVVDSSLEDCPAQATAWIVYASERAVWRFEGKYKGYLGLRKYAHTYREDIDCYMALAAAWKILAVQDTTACDADYLDYLAGVADAGYLVPHVLFDYVCLENPYAARHFSNEAIEDMREYVNKYILVRKG